MWNCVNIKCKRASSLWKRAENFWRNIDSKKVEEMRKKGEMLLCFEERDCKTIAIKWHICVKLTCDEKMWFSELETAYEEIHAKFIFHTNHYRQSTQSAITLYFPHADTNIMV